MVEPLTAGSGGGAGRTLVVTGSGQGIGRAVSIAAARRGYAVVGLDIDAQKGEETARLSGGSFHRCDLADAAQIAPVFEAIEAESGGVDVLVNNAARGIHRPPEEVTIAEWDGVMAVSLRAAAFAAQAAGRAMIARGAGGSIVNLASIGGLAALGRGNYVYSVAKAGLIGMTRELAVEWASYGIRVNALAPSQVDTEGFRPLIAREDVASGNTLADALSGVPLGRLAHPDEVADAVLFLASEQASFISGVTLPIDGGSMAFHAGGSLRR